jgi:hypothetical protein
LIACIAINYHVLSAVHQTHPGQHSTSLSTLVGLLVVAGIVLCVWAAGMSRIFTKAGRSGLLAFVPFVNYVVLFSISGHSPWGALGPRFGVWHWRMNRDLAASFDRGTLFAFGMALLPFLFMPIIGFSGDQYLRARDAGPVEINPGLQTSAPTYGGGAWGAPAAASAWSTASEQAIADAASGYRPPGADRPD